MSAALLSKTFRRVANQRGFSLIEVLIAMAILAVALVALIGTQSKSMVVNDHARQLTTASILAHDQMLALESELLKDGFNADTEFRSGYFDGREYKAFKWEALIEVLDLDPENLASEMQGQLLGTDSDAGALSGASAVSSQLPSMLGFVTLMLQNLTQERIRKVTLAVRWDDLKGEHVYTLRHFIVMMQKPEEVGAETTVPSLPTVP